MAKRKDKFSVGQTVVLVLCKESGWERLNGELGLVIGSCRYDIFECSRFEVRKTVKGEPDGGSWRYTVKYRDGVTNLCEHQMRAIYEGEKLSTWDKFTKRTGIAISAQPAVRRKTPAKAH